MLITHVRDCGSLHQTIAENHINTDGSGLYCPAKALFGAKRVFTATAQPLFHTTIGPQTRHHALLTTEPSEQNQTSTSTRAEATAEHTARQPRATSVADGASLGTQNCEL